VRDRRRHGRAPSGRTLLLAVALSAAAALAGCGYHVAGSSSVLPPNVHTIAVPAFSNKTSYYRIEQIFTQAVVREMLVRTRYRVVPRAEDADTVLHAEIDGVETSAMVFDSATGRANEILVTVRMKASLEDRASGKVLYHNDNFVFREPYEISENIPVFFQQEGPALDRMARDFAARLVSNILEGF
jgi:outer membrane lipopolysaccharide assembly protein LptE/RlpB